MKHAISALSGVMTGAIYTVLVGYLAKLAVGLQGGAVYDFWGRISTVTDPGKQWLPLLGVALVSALTLLLVTRGTARFVNGVRVAFALGFTVVIAGVVIYALAVSGPDHIQRIQELDPLLGVPNWVNSAGTSSATHLVLLVVLAWLWTRRSVDSD